MDEQTGNEPTNTVAQAERVLAELESKRNSLVESHAVDDEQRRAAAFGAFTGDKAARATLDKLNAAAARFDSELRSIEDAIAVAQDHLHQGRQQEAVAAEKTRAQAIREVLVEFTECALSLDEALLAIADEGNALRSAVRKLRELGCTFPTDAQVLVLGLQCVQTALMQTPWARKFPHLAPRDRRSWSALCHEWSSRIEANYVAPHLGEQQATTREHEEVA